MRTLLDLKTGEKAIVKKITGYSLIHRRLLDMGIVSGTCVQLVKSAPLGDPLEFKIKGYHLSLRKSEASTVEIM
ncbi:MAG TPA: ferrous iron transport protein A [Candidatus Eremiobacteraeota bacterium]|nr:ferrous iron transport protein A [Candidatus Eremiobacteraeota bacterium]